ncbi:MAG: serine/threonine-protein kinase [Gemmatimonadota bacterium]|nr:serine/threonine-protein kinase [Gemmatimonadota bacterium]
MSDQLERLTAAMSGRYRIEREVGAGGMATVYLANDLKHDRKVALKVLRPEMAAALGPDRFPREISIVAKFQHPHILPLHDSGEIGGFLYYVMPFVEGESLRARIDREGALPINDATRILKQVVDALAYAHARGIVHRDIKPDNVMLSGRHAVVTDFGVAKAVSASGGEKLTTMGMAVGTPHYMAPEQATADENVDHRADIYAIGVLAYEMLTGKAPFTGKTAQAVLSAQVLQQPPPIEELRTGVPAPVVNAIMQCLEKDPDDRWQTAEAMLHDLESAVTTPTGGVTPADTHPVQPLPRRTRGARRWWIPSVAAAVIVVGGVGAWLVATGDGGDGGIDRIAVLPIEDISGQDDVFVLGMQDALTNSLAQLDVVTVVPRSAVLPYRDVPTRDIARELDLDAVVEATVFRAGDVMRITVQFVDPNTAQHLWSEMYEQDVRDVLSAQNEVVTQIAEAIVEILSQPESTALAGEGG